MNGRLFVVPLAAVFALSACGAPPAEAPRASTTPPAPPLDRAAATRAVSAVLDDLHDAAAHADEVRYFAHYAPDAVFLGTDATERWDLAAFEAYAHPHFAAGHGWTYRSTRRAITLSADGAMAWFDEDLVGERVGPTRGSGVLRKSGDAYLIVQYNLAFTIPNARFDEVHALLDPAAVRASSRKVYDDAVAAATAGDLAKARQLLGALVPAAKTRPADDAEFWLHNQLTWIEWADGQLPAALRETDDAKLAAMHGTLPPAAVRALLLHAYWDRAYLLREVARAAKDDKKLVQSALDAKREYDELARAERDDDGMNVLAAFFAVRAGDAKAALAAATKVDAEKDSDLQDLYVLALAFDLAKEAAKANALRERICAGKAYLMKPLLVRALANEGKACR